MLILHSHHFRLHRTMIFYDGHDGIDLASENIVPVVHCCSYGYSWSQCQVFALLVLPTATRLRVMKKKPLSSLYSNLHSEWKMSLSRWTFRELLREIKFLQKGKEVIKLLCTCLKLISEISE